MRAKFSGRTKEELRKRVGREKDCVTLKKVQAVLLGAEGFTAKTVSAMTQYKEGYVRELWCKYRKNGEAIFLSGNTKTRNNAYLSREEEKEFLTPFLEKAKAAGILIVLDVHKALEARIGKKIPKETTYHLLHRHNWRKIVPRRYHPQRDSEKRAAWIASFPPEDSGGSKESKRKKS